jgi:hypothetical protein
MEVDLMDDGEEFVVIDEHITSKSTPHRRNRQSQLLMGKRFRHVIADADNC